MHVYSRCERACFLLVLVTSVAGFSSLFRVRPISKPAERIVYPTRGQKQCVVCVSSLSTSYSDIGSTERSTIAAVSGNSTVHEVTAAFFFVVGFFFCFCQVSRSRFIKAVCGCGWDGLQFPHQNAFQMCFKWQLWWYLSSLLPLDYSQRTMYLCSVVQLEKRTVS